MSQKTRTELKEKSVVRPKGFEAPLGRVFSSLAFFLFLLHSLLLSFLVTNSQRPRPHVHPPRCLEVATSRMRKK